MSAGKRTSGRTWAYVASTLGGLVSIAANIGHSLIPTVVHPGAVALSALWPVFLFVAIEVLARTPWPLAGQQMRGWGVLVRWVGLPPVALVAAVVSYRHLSGLLAFYSEDALTVAIGPLAVDGIMIMAVGALIVTGHRTPDNRPEAPDTATGHVLYRPFRLNDGPGRVEAIVSAPPVLPDTAPDTEPANRPEVPDTEPDTGQGMSAPAGQPDTAPAIDRTPDNGPAIGTAALVAALVAELPAITQAEAAERLGKSERTVRRYWPAPTQRINGHTIPLEGTS